MAKDTDDDATLVRRAAAGDRDALATLFDRFAPVVTRVAWTLTSTPDEARGTVQDTFGILWDRVGDLQLATASLLPWLLATCRDVAQRTTAHPPSAGDPFRWVRDAMDALTPDDRSLCEWCVVDGRRYDDAARDLGLPLADGATARPTEQPRRAVTRDGH
ncbi:RNA polymerase sigma factor [Curtobacterium sp. ER1/6]|uniref:RNA polymerase sigma factor n=1 Tax=Curtobacterium sp. ER1/6 TaxID=1891920 RepID=UPI00084F941C|nr:hypothetical protein [Curtobacterium sp. ER1/6]OEI67826.1 hypothetical protein Cus16_2577 [Curtobacterium sp. ER1/6]